MTMTEAEEADRRRRLEAVEAALACRDALRLVLPAKDVEAAIAGLRAERQALLGVVAGPGAVALGQGAVAAGQGGMAAGRDIVQVTVAPPGAAPGGTSLVAVYLRRLIEDAGFIRLADVDPGVTSGDKDARLELQAVYTDLLTLSRREEGELGEVLETEDQEEAEEGSEEGAVSALEQLNRHARLVLLGDPGSGKSTFVNFVAISLAGQALGLRDANLELLGAGSPRSWRHGALLPVRIVMRDFAARGLPDLSEQGTARRVWEFLATELADAGIGEFFPALRRELLEGRGLALFDGLDEVPAPERRREQICQAVEDFSKSIGSSRVLLTSRTYAYQDQAWRLRGFEEAVLAPFGVHQIDRFVGLWYEQMVGLGRLRQEDARGRAELLRRAIFASDRLLGLAERPLLLTLMASLHAGRGSLPERREQLYNDALELLLNTWEGQRRRVDRQGRPVLEQPSLAEWLRVDREEVRQALEAVAFEAHSGQAELSGTADVEEGRLVGRLLHLSRKPDADRDADGLQLVSYLRDRAGLLIERGMGVYTFPHRTFQEYLAARHLTGSSFPSEAAQLGREAPGRWREVVLLAGAKAGRGALASVWSLADALCFREPAKKTSSHDEWGALLSGQLLAESADLREVSAANEVKLDRIRRWLVHLMRASHFPVLERKTAGRVLARLGDPRFDGALYNMPKESLLGFVEVAEGPFEMGSDAADDPAIPRNEHPRHEVWLPTFWMGRYPVTVGQFLAFLEESDYEPADPLSTEGFTNHPVANVDLRDALAYCKWLGKRLRDLAGKRLKGKDKGKGSLAFWRGIEAGTIRVCLPSEAEWEKAARGGDGRTYPWGRVADAERGNFDETKFFERTAVGCFSGGASPYGCEDMSGNVLEWTRSAWEPYPYVARDEREKAGASSRVIPVLRGGAFNCDFSRVRCSCRFGHTQSYRDVTIGFRLAVSPISAVEGIR